MKRVITEYDIIGLIKKGIRELSISKNDLLTPSAKDLLKSSDIKIINEISIKSELKRNKIIIGSDHTGVRVKKTLIDFLKNKNYEVYDVGAYNEDSVDYPDIALKVAERIAVKEYDLGILLDATGIPSAITANKIKGIRAATCYNEFSAKSSREHNDANILVLGAKAIGEETIKSICDVWLNTEFLGERHQKRLDKIKAIEEKYFTK